MSETPIAAPPLQPQRYGLVDAATVVNVVGEIGEIANLSASAGSPVLEANRDAFGPADVGAQVFGPGIVDGTTVLSVDSSSSATLSAPATATGEVSIKVERAPGMAGGEIVASARALMPGLVTPSDIALASHWLSGVAFAPESAEVPALYDPCSGGALAAAPSARKANRIFHPFLTEVADQCSTYGWQKADYIGRARRALEVKEGWAVEREVETGALFPAEAHLAMVDSAAFPLTTLNSGTSTDPTSALLLLTDAIARANVGLAYIHAPAMLVELWATKFASNFIRVGTHIETINGNIVVSGNGYGGFAPDGTGGAAITSVGASAMWAYATAPMVLYRDRDITVTPNTLAQATDRARNLVVYRASRAWVAVWNGLLHVAVKVNTTLA